MVCASFILAAGLATGSTAAAAEAGAAAGHVPLPHAVVASAAIREAMLRFEETGVFRLEMAPRMQDQPQPEECYADYHPLEHELWNLPSPPPPDCPGAAAAARCIAEWFARWREDLYAVHEAWEDAYCYCQCCHEEGGFDTKQDCLEGMTEVFRPEFQGLLNRYYGFHPAGCCPAERHEPDAPGGPR